MEILHKIILECPIFLNTKRAAEERNRSIRWLRPKYQSPDPAKLPLMETTREKRYYRTR